MSVLCDMLLWCSCGAVDVCECVGVFKCSDVMML